ncbi:hypothetical protein NDU88_008645 [Pleurodeles waltl]|uniref:Uncharacterized protein n=1 Tax=Pleurodeles waltl TaxID=8319 RepID=A0AAV7QPC4_PLEWA|nr:hypothetical protein NDU88_008645 [Pleurodeles waltl]
MQNITRKALWKTPRKQSNGVCSAAETQLCQPALHKKQVFGLVLFQQPTPAGAVRALESSPRWDNACPEDPLLIKPSSDWSAASEAARRTEQDVPPRALGRRATVPGNISCPPARCTLPRKSGRARTAPTTAVPETWQAMSVYPMEHEPYTKGGALTSKETVRFRWHSHILSEAGTPVPGRVALALGKMLALFTTRCIKVQLLLSTETLNTE